MKQNRLDRYALPLVLAALIVLTLVSYWRIGRNGFVFDDAFYLTGNPNVQQGINLDSVRWAFTAFYGANWQPLTWLSSMLDYELYGTNPAGHHATNLVLHLASAILLLMLLRRITGSLWKSGFVAAVFALHPLHVESVAWASERKDVLSAFFMLLTVWAYVGYAANPNVRRYLLVAGAFALGLMAKPMLVSLPILLLMLDIWPLGRLRTGAVGVDPRVYPQPRAGQTRGSAPTALIVEKLPLFALSAASCVITFMAQRSGEAVVRLEKFPVGLRVANSVVSYAAYIGKAIYPAGLTAYYPYPRHGIPALSIVIVLVVLAAVSVLAIRLARSKPYLAVGWLWYVITLVPVIGLVQVGEQAMADRYMYIPLIGLSIMVAWGVPDLLRRPRPIALGIVGGLVVLAMVPVTAAQVGHWESNYTLFRRAATVTPGSALVFSNYGMALAERGENEQAVEQYEKAIKADPLYIQSYLNMGLALNDLGRTDEALSAFRKALDLNPGYTDAARAAAFVHNDLGLALAQKGDNKAAISHFEQAVELDPDCVQAHGSLAIAYFTVGRYREAWEEVRIVQSHGMEPPPGFVDALSARMPAP